MKILQINLSDYTITGGVGISMYQLHSAMIKSGFDSKILCLFKQLGGSEIIKLERSLSTKIIESILMKVEFELGLNEFSRVFTTLDLKKNSAYREADVITLHCVHDKFISYLSFPDITKEKPIVYYMHDMWAFTGHCHYSYECDRWKTGCGQCPHPEVAGYIKRDNTRLEWKLKDWAYRHSNFHIAAPSKWMYNLAQESMLNRFPIHHIPHGIDTEVYYPINSEHCRSVLGIPNNKKVLMFNALSIKDYRKGGDLLLNALEKLPESLKSEILLLTIGGGDELSQSVGIQAINMGFISSKNFKAILYSAADLFICPTRADNSPLVLYESMACGTPMVSFNIGGVPDLVRPGITGLLAEPENVEELTNCIVQLLEDDNLRSSMSQQCRKIAMEEYSLDLYVQRFINLYKQVLETDMMSAEKQTSMSVNTN
ncbi:glycosyl transferase [Hapalosiphon sp. MRB220]|nr:glycosyl transferase [Hapalosiphon sp. MRB220]